MELKDYAKLVKKTRDAQKAFFKLARTGGFGKDEALKNARALERHLDETTETLLATPQPEQTEMKFE